jgi:MoaA/NifB/PqqE/SkfB family radical SAM enzyme
MYDIDFFKKSNNLKNKITSGLLKSADIEDISIELESLRKKSPHIYNIETTNYCNMKCVMCPRTMFMTRKNVWIDDALFENLIVDIKIHDQKNLESFWNWLENDYKQPVKEMSENGFYFSIISRHLVLHGFGEPFLDKNLIKRIELCSKNKIPTYFSCTPATMTIEKAEKAMEAGLDVLKFSLDAMDERKIQKIRGKRADFEDSIKKILKLLDIKRKKNLKTFGTLYDRLSHG